MLCKIVCMVLSVGAVMTPSATESSDDDDTLQTMLNEGLLNNTQNLEKIRAAFEVEPGAVKICVPLTYNITCTDQEDCDNEATSFNCTNGYTTTFIWTKYNTNSISGSFLFFYASGNFDVLGFEWSGACDVLPNLPTGPNRRNQRRPGPVLDIKIPSLLCSNRNQFNTAISKLTRKVSSQFYPVHAGHNVLTPPFFLLLQLFMSYTHAAQILRRNISTIS